VKPGEIWGYTDPAGKEQGWKVVAHLPPMGQSTRHIVDLVKVKDATGELYTLVVTPEGIPMHKNGGVHPAWKLIEEAPRGTDKR
jgi:hypothetical protein